jgi:hypothetical protein
VQRVDTRGFTQLRCSRRVFERRTSFGQALFAVDAAPEGKLTANASAHRGEHLEQQPRTVLEAAPVTISPRVGRR